MDQFRCWTVGEQRIISLLLRKIAQAQLVTFLYRSCETLRVRMENNKKYEDNEYEIMKNISNYIDVNAPTRGLWVMYVLHWFSSKPKSHLIRQHNKIIYRIKILE